MKEIKSPFWRTIYEYGLITVSIWIMVVGIYFFQIPKPLRIWRNYRFFHCSQPAYTLVRQ